MLHIFLNDFYLLLFTGKPKFSLSFGPSYVEKGRNVTLPMCHVTGYPPAVITWVKVYNGLEKPRAIAKDGQLSIINTQKKDSGLYKCTASNKLGHSSAVTHLNVVELPHFTVRPPSQLEVDNQECNNPLPGDRGPTAKNYVDKRKRGATCWEIESWCEWNTKNMES